MQGNRVNRKAIRAFAACSDNFNNPNKYAFEEISLEHKFILHTYAPKCTVRYATLNDIRNNLYPNPFV